MTGTRIGIRIDKWLWAARFFRTRELASKACEIGRVDSNGVRAKPAREVHTGDMLHIQNEGGTFAVEVLGLSQQRGSAAIAQALYRETEASAEARRKAADERRLLGPGPAPFAPSRRPSKRDRRLIHSFSGKR
jgi:ribosome-associated heat shock protein Hsp15